MGRFRKLSRLLRRLAGRASTSNVPVRAASAPHEIALSASLPEHGRHPRPLDHEFLPLPNQTPFEMLPVYRYLRETIPDVSDAVWTWKRLCHTGYDVEIVDASSQADAARAQGVLDALRERVHARDGGLDGLLDIFYTSLFTFGAAAIEVVPGRTRSWIHDMVPVDVWTVRFRRKGAQLETWQVAEGELVRMPDDCFLYVGLDRDGTNPYGRSMLRAVPAAIRIQQELLSDMAKATRNAGWNKLHVRYHAEERQPGESVEAYQERVSGNLRALRDRLSGAAIDQNLVTFDNVEVNVLGGAAHSLTFYDNHKAVEEQVITGMHMMPVLMGRNYGSTETYGTAQFEVVNRQVTTVNRLVSAMLGRVFNLELALRGESVRARVHMRGNRTVDILKDAETRGREIDNLLRLRDAKLMSATDAQQAATALMREH